MAIGAGNSAQQPRSSSQLINKQVVLPAQS